MKLKVRYLGVTLLTASVYLACVAPSLREPQSQPAAPPDDGYFYLQRVARDGRLNLKARPAALKQARLLKARLHAQAGFSPLAVGVWELRGPLNVGGRVSDVVGDPMNPDKFYLGAASGGVWKTTNGGASFTPIFDNQGSLSIGALAIDPSNSDVLYVGTGEASPGGGSVTYPGDGIWKTTNGGATWQHLGLEETVAIGRIVVNPDNPDIVFVAAMGNLFSRNPERGVYRSLNGGQTWTRVLFVSDIAGAIDLAIDSSNPNRIYAATWERIRLPNQRIYGGPGSGVWRSQDGGNSWTRLIFGLPAASTEPSRIGVAVSPSSPNTVYAVYHRKADGCLEGVFRSTDFGTNWTRRPATNLSSFLGCQGTWSGRIFVHPQRVGEIWVDGVGLGRSVDGGGTFAQVGGMHVDHHSQWFMPANPNVILKGNDGGLYRSTNGGSTWSKLGNLPISQFYTVEAHQQESFKIYGGLQDNGVKRTATGGLSNWSNVIGGDGMEVLVDIRNPDVIYAASQFGNLRRSTNDGASFTAATTGVTGRRNWKMPLVIDPASTGTGLSTTLYLGSHQLFRSVNSAGTWTAISPDLTDGANGTLGTITTIAVASSTPNTIYAGTDDGNVWVTMNAGATYTRIDATLPDLWVTRVAVDPDNDATAYVTFSGFRVDEPLAHVFRTTNHGATWTNISSDLPDAPVNDIAIEPRRASTLYVATDVGVFVTHDLGASWVPLGTGLPDGVVVTDIKVLEGPPATLYAGTYGRSIHSIELPEPPSGATVLEAHFDANPDGFAYQDDAFRNTSQPAYASGAHVTQGGFSDGALRVDLGGVDEADILGMSGAWARTFMLSAPSSSTTLSLRVQVTQSPHYEADEISQGLVSVNGVMRGLPPGDSVAEVVGDGNAGTPRSSGWRLVTLRLGPLPAGTHSLAIGGFNNKKTLADESTEVWIDDVVVVATP